MVEVGSSSVADSAALYSSACDRVAERRTVIQKILTFSGMVRRLVDVS
jgi:hypothetical protein